MPLFRIETKKRWGAAEWGNRYYVTAADQAAAATAGAAIALVEQAHLWNGVTLFGIRVSTAAADGRTGRTFPTNYVGALAYNYPLPIFCAGVVEFYPGIKQAGKKYFRFCLAGDGQIAGTLNSAGQGVMNDFASDLLALGTIQDSAGTTYTNAVASTKLGMHQTYRAWAARAGVDEGD